MCVNKYWEKDEFQIRKRLTNLLIWIYFENISDKIYRKDLKEKLIEFELNPKLIEWLGRTDEMQYRNYFREKAYFNLKAFRIDNLEIDRVVDCIFNVLKASESITKKHLKPYTAQDKIFEELKKEPNY